MERMCWWALSLGAGMAIACASSPPAQAMHPDDHSPSPVLASSSASNVVFQKEPASPTQIAQLFYPPATPEQQVLMVMGQGQVSRPADKAAIQLIFLNYDPYAYADSYTEPTAVAAPEARPESSVPEASPESATESVPEPTPLTPDKLKSVIDAIATTGVPANSIKVTAGSNATASTYADYGEGSATVSFEMTQPTSQQIERLMTAVDTAVEQSDKLFLQDRYVTYTTERCDDLARDAYTDAIADARNRANVLARAMRVELSDVPSVAESTSIFAGFPFNPYASACDLESLPTAITGYGYPAPSYYDPMLPATVEVSRTLYVTYPIRPR